jgi:hypothetical protein
MAKIHYIRPNRTTALPSHILFLDCETKGQRVGDLELHRMYMAWTWRVTLDKSNAMVRDKWTFWTDPVVMGDYIESEARAKAPLYVVGSNITFDLFASGLAEHLHNGKWKAELLYDKGLTTIISLKRDGRRLRFLALQNFLQGGVKQWGELLGIEKMEVDFENDSFEQVKEYCRRDVEITGRTFLEYIRFVDAHDMGGFGVTAPAQAFRAFRHRFLKERILHYDQYAFNQFVRRGYYGGRVECGYIGEIAGHRMVKLDINSMYPAVMRGQEYPTRLRQWIREPDRGYVTGALARHCAMAEVELQTHKPAFPLRERGKLIFPTGEFSTILCTASLRYALELGVVTKVRQLLLFDKADLFTDYVDYFVPLRQKYQREGNKVWAASVKILLNSLYGKFGEKRERELVKTDEEEGHFYRRPVALPREEAELEPHEFDWRYEPEEWELEEYVEGMEWAAFGTYCLSVGAEEGPNSQPSIAAHVTDYARMLMWRYMERVGLDNVLYTDTDSLIIPKDALGELQGELDPVRLGALKIEGEANTADFRGPKDYTFGEERHIKGIRVDAKEVGVGSYQQDHFPGLHSLMRMGCLDAFPIGPITKTLKRAYDKGDVQGDGRVFPLKLG